MKKSNFITFMAIYLALSFGAATLAGEGVFEYPCYLVDAYDADDSCWTGMDADGEYEGPIRVVPEKWLVGPPLSEMSGVTLPPDHWVEVQFRGPIIDGPDNDILLIELGPVSEQALIFITDGAGTERLIGIATSGTQGGGVDPTNIGFDISGIELPFQPRAVRILGLDNGGEAPGFDIANIRARICTDCGEIACNPIPVDGAKKVQTDVILSFSPGQYAEKHKVYLSTDFAAVASGADTAGLPPQDANTFDPGGLQLDTTYYWRIDEVNDQNIWPGEVWSFTTTDHLIVDDFEAYNKIDPPDPNSNRIKDTWVEDGISFSMEQTHKCSKKSMEFFFSYYRTSDYSEAVRTFFPPQDWTASGQKVLELFFSGQTYYASTAQMYIALNDGNTEALVPYPGDPNELKSETWRCWRIELDELENIDLSNIESFSIGFCAEPDKPYSSGSGTVFFDDIRLYSSRCLAENVPEADFNRDCLVNFYDLEEMAFSWLDTRYNIYPVAEPNAPVAWYEFENDLNDSAGIARGQRRGEPSYTEGVYGQAISFDGYEDAVGMTHAVEVFSKISTEITIAFWEYGADSPNNTDTLCCSNYTYGEDDPAIAINLGCWMRPGEYNWDCGRPWSFDNRLSGNHRYPGEWLGRWNHWAFTKDAEEGVMKIFLNGLLYDSRDGAYAPISGITSFDIGSGWYGGYDGLIDDFRIYDYALTQPEIVHAATKGTGIFDQKLITPADLNGDNKIDFKDFAMLADHWLENTIWP